MPRVGEQAVREQARPPLTSGKAGEIRWPVFAGIRPSDRQSSVGVTASARAFWTPFSSQSGVVHLIELDNRRALFLAHKESVRLRCPEVTDLLGGGSVGRLALPVVRSAVVCRNGDNLFRCGCGLQAEAVLTADRSGAAAASAAALELSQGVFLRLPPRDWWLRSRC